MPAYTFRGASAADWPLVSDLLVASKLPLAGAADHLSHFVLAFDGDTLAGCAGLELYGRAALLRSVAVASSERGKGLGVAIVEQALDRARRAGISDVILLTETAPRFFPRFGFETITRAEVPESVKASVEFTGACCASAVAMRLRLGARPASTVIVLREREPGGIEVLLVRRNDSVAFMAGAHVFPGGRVDRADHPQGAIAGRPSRFPDLDPARDLAHRRAAVRELAEEANVHVSVDDVEPVAHWVTPAIEIRRYDTRFFLARMPAGQVARHDESETTALVWLTPSDALAKAGEGAITLPPPTWTLLQRLSHFATVDDALRWARATPIVRIEPGFVKTDACTMLTLPGDPLHPALPGGDVPEHTRFVLEGGRWLPASAGGVPPAPSR